MMARGSWAARTAIMLLAVLAGCGIKSPPRPPQFVLPETIRDLRASAALDGIKLTWTRPTRYTGGDRMRDLNAFVVFRAEGPGQFAPLVEIPVTDRERFQYERKPSYVDDDSVVGHSYRYIVIAVTTDGYEGHPSNVVELTRTPPAQPPEPGPLPEAAASPAP